MEETALNGSVITGFHVLWSPDRLATIKPTQSKRFTIIGKTHYS